MSLTLNRKISLRDVGTRGANPARMNRPLPTAEIAPLRRGGIVGTVAARLGRDAIWLLLAAAFGIVEMIVFVTELPVGKIFHRTATKVSRAGR